MIAFSLPLVAAVWATVGVEKREAVRADRLEDAARRKRLQQARPGLKEERKRFNLFELKHRRDVLTGQLSELRRATERATGEERAALATRLETVERMLAQTEADIEAGEAAKDALRENRAQIQDTKNFRITPLAGPGFTPEQGFLIGGGLQLSWTTDRLDPELPRSNLPLLGSVNSNGGYGFDARLKTYWIRDRLRVNLDAGGGNQPDHYWGVGFAAAREPIKKGPTTEYLRQSWRLQPAVFARPWKRIFVGPVADFNRTRVREPSKRVAEDPDVVAFGRDNLNAGLGLRLAWDNRDVPVNAYRGVLFAVSGTFYAPAFGSDNAYRAFELDYRQYVTVVRSGSTIAWQVRGRYTLGDVPYAEKTFLGGVKDFRGYYRGRYRDDLVVYGLVEYRYMFKRMKVRPNRSPLSRHGFVVWAGVGGLGPNFGGLTNWLPNTGFGYRFEVQPRLNARLDIGFGEDSIGFYLNFLEAF